MNHLNVILEESLNKVDSVLFKLYDIPVLTEAINHLIEARNKLDIALNSSPEELIERYNEYKFRNLTDEQLEKKHPRHSL